MNYYSKPIDTSNVTLDSEMQKLLEILAANFHDIWASEMISEGWTFGSERNFKKQIHPGLIPFDELVEKEKSYDRKLAREYIKAMMSLGYKIIKE